MERITPAEARAIVLHHLLLDGGARGLPRGREGAARVIEQLGYVQIDTIAVVERAHHHALWTRRPDYRPAWLDELLAARRVFEYWGHAMCYLPLSDYRFYLPRMRRSGGLGSWHAESYRTHRRLMRTVLERVRAEGPLCASDFEAPAGRRGTWWDWKPAKLALELLYWRGELMIAARRGFQKVYDLTERVLPPGTDTTPPTDDECARFVVRRALGALGVAAERELSDYLHAAPRPAVRLALRELCAAGEVTALRVDGCAPTYYAAPAALAASPAPRAPGARTVRILSPFDHLVIHRPRLSRLFGFEYRLECYTPAAKREHGYFTLPLLLGDQLIGRLDLKAEREARRLAVRGLRLEPAARPLRDEALPLLAAALGRFAAFNGCDAHAVVVAPRVAPGLRRALAAVSS